MFNKNIKVREHCWDILRPEHPLTMEARKERKTQSPKTYNTSSQCNTFGLSCKNNLEIVMGSIETD